MSPPYPHQWQKQRSSVIGYAMWARNNEDERKKNVNFFFLYHFDFAVLHNSPSTSLSWQSFRMYSALLFFAQAFHYLIWKWYTRKKIYFTVEYSLPECPVCRDLSQEWWRLCWWGTIVLIHDEWSGFLGLMYDNLLAVVSL